MPWRVGGRVGFTVDAIAVPESTGLVLEVLVRIPPATISQLARDSLGVARVQADFVVRRPGTRAPMTTTRTFTLALEDSLRGQGKVVTARFDVGSGEYPIQVKLTDLLSHRGATFLPGGSANFSQLVSGRVTLPSPQASFDLSDIEFLWPTGAEPASMAFVRAGRVVVPNPDRLYGLMVTEARARFVARGHEGTVSGPWRWVARVFDEHGQAVFERESTATAATVLDTDVAFDVSDLPSGAYELEVKVGREGDKLTLARRSGFSVGWQPDTWLRNAADIANEVHFLLSARGEEQFAIMQPGAQERLLQEFWARRDPTPETARNEAYETFRQRIAHANETFTRIAAEPGMFSDMGRVYIRWGEPTEVLRQIMPAGNETLAEQLQRIIDSETRMPSNVLQPGPGGDMRPFEVWIYEGNTPMPLDIDPHERDRGLASRRMLFLFVDNQGSGIYRLRYSTE